MIREIGVELQAYLRAKGFPFAVVDGPEPTKTVTWGRERIVIEHGDGTDSFGPPVSQSINPKVRRTRTPSYKLTIYAKSAKSGATVFEHKRRAEQVLDAVLVGMDYVARAPTRRSRWNPVAGRFITPVDLEGSEIPGGAAYELAFTFDRAVMEKTWAGTAAAEFTIAAYTMTGAPTLTFAAADDSITRSAGSWLTDGFAVGMTVRVRGTASNNVEGVIATATALVLTISTALTNEGPVTGCTVEAGGTTTTTTVDDTDDATMAEAV